MEHKQLIERLFASESRQARVALLAGVSLEGSIERVMAAAIEQAAANPEAARETLLAVAQVADSEGHCAYGAQARYVAAQNFAANGQLNIALNLIESARAAYAKLGKTQEVLRTHIGRINVLAELGRYGEALEMANHVVAAVSAEVHPTQESEELRCLAWLNMGSCYWHMGAHTEALTSFASAEAGFRRIGAAHRLPAVANNRGLVLMELGRVREAIEAFLFTAGAAEAAQARVPQGQALANAARGSSLLGEFAQALARFGESRKILEGMAATDEAIILRETADLYLALNLYEEARAAYHDSIAHLRASGARRHLGWSLWGLGACALATEDWGMAERSLAEAAEVFSETDNAMSLSGVLLERSSLRLKAGQTDAAQADAAHALALVSRSELVAAKAFAHLRLAESLWGTPERAAPHVMEAQRLSAAVGLPQLLFRCQLRAGQLRRAQGRLPEARACFEAAVGEVERLRGRIPQEAVRASFMGDKAEAYQEWVGVLIETGALTAAFDAAEHAKSRSLVDLLSGGTAGGAAAEPHADLHAELMAVYNRLLSSDAAVHAGGLGAELRARARALEAALQGEMLTLPTVHAEGELSPGTPLSLERIHAQLPERAALIEYYCTGTEILAMVVTRGGLRVERRLGTMEQVRGLSDRLQVQLQRCEVRGALDGAWASGLENGCRRVLNALHDVLIAPLLREFAKDAGNAPRELVVVPHGALHRLPFHAFCDAAGRYLIEDYHIAYAPSATVWALCQQRRRKPIEAALLVGSHTAALPSIAEEITALGALMPTAQVLRDGAATRAAVLAEAGGRDLIHLACHGTFRTDNPLYSALQMADGWLTAADLLRMDLRGTLVTLSACETGRSHVTGGDELTGFARAALAAGASSVLVSGWRVDDGTTAQLMSHFYQALQAGAGRARALRTAQLALKAAHPHPWHWAAFSLSGQG